MPWCARRWVQLLSVLALGCAGAPGRTDQASAAAPASSDAAAAPREPDAGPTPARWQIDGTSVAAAVALPQTLARALREHGREVEEVQDHLIADVNGDGALDAVVLLPAPAVAGAYDYLALLSSGESIRVHELAALVDGAIFAVALVPLVDGPTLIAAGPRLGSCERGPSWTFLRPTGDLLEAVGRLAVEPYDCAAAEASFEFLRGADGRVEAVELRHGEARTRYEWDATLGNWRRASTRPST